MSDSLKVKKKNKKDKKSKKEKVEKKSKKLNEKKVKKNKCRLKKKEKNLVLLADPATTAGLCEKKLLEGGCAYLATRNERWEPVHIQTLIRFHKRMCTCMDELTKLLFEHIEKGNLSDKEAEVYMSAMQGRCFGLLLPVIDVIQEIVDEKEIDMLYDSFEWMEDPKQMTEFLAKIEDYESYNKQLKKLLTVQIDDIPEILEYESTLIRE